MNPVDCPSRIDRVVVYARGAVVTRKVALPADLPAGALELRIGGLTALAEPGSVRARIAGDREVVALRSRVALPAAPVRPGQLAERVRSLRLESTRLDTERAARAAERQRLGAVKPSPKLSRWARRQDAAARFEDALALGGVVGAEIARLDRLVADLDQAIADHRRKLAAAELEAVQGTTGDLASEDRALLEVLVRLGEAGAVDDLFLEYVVGAARWWPAYTARLTAAAAKASLSVDAFVAQASGEDWSGVHLAISSADLAQDARLPELRSIRVGRAQPPARKGYRSPPIGLDAMFEGFDRAAALLPPREDDTRAPARDKGGAETAALFSLSALAAAGPGATSTRAGSVDPEAYAAFQASYGAPPPAGAPAPAQPRPASIPMARLAMPMSRAAMPEPMPQAIGRAKSAGIGGLLRGAAEAASSLSEEALPDGGGGGLRNDLVAAPPLALEPEEGWFDFDALTLADPLADAAHRGRLVKEAPRASSSRAAAVQSLAGLAAPSDARDPLETRGRFDHRWDAEGTADVPSSGRPHRVAVASAEGPSKPRFVAVPREAAEVYREAEIKNPFAAPLLAGPVEVFLDGALLTTSSLAFVDRGGTMHLGLGVEERLRVARNARVEESSAGLLGGSTAVEHTVTIDVASSLGREIDVEVIDRLPVSDEKEIEIKKLWSRPEPAKYTQADRGAPVRGGLAWSIAVPAGEKKRIEFAYRVTLPSKNEIVGGNRRE
jgi:Domain of unknown function (DUF4139)/N-terminal domain of unknown function (DUF4140)